MFGSCPGVDLGQQLLHPPQDSHLQRLILFGHQRWQVSAWFERGDRLHHWREIHIPVFLPQWVRVLWTFFHPQPLHVALRAGVQLRVAAPASIRGQGVLVCKCLRSVVVLSWQGAAGRGWGSGGVQVLGEGRGWSPAGCPGNAGAF